MCPAKDKGAWLYFFYPNKYYTTFQRYIKQVSYYFLCYFLFLKVIHSF